MNNEALNRLRVPAAWALLGAVVAQMLGGLVYIFGHGSAYDASVAANFTGVGSDLFHGPVLIGMLVAAVALVVTAPTKTSVNFPVVLVALILTGLAALMGVVGVIMGFVNANETGNLADGFASFLSVGGQLAVIAVAGLFVLRVFGDHELVPRSGPQQGMPMGQPGFPPQTGAQQSFAPQGYPTGGQQAFGQQGYPTGGQPAYQQPQQQDWAVQQDWAAQQTYGAPQQQPGGYDPNQQYQQSYGADPAAQGYVQEPVAQQPYGAAPAAGQTYAPQEPMAHPGYGTDPAQQQYYGADAPGGQAYMPQEPVAQSPYGVGSGGQQPYTQTWGQPGESYPHAGTGQETYQPGYSASGGQSAYGQDWQQQGYGQAYQPGYDPYGQQAYGTGGQPAYGAGSGGQLSYGTGTGEQVYGGGYGTGGHQPYGTGGQPAYGADPAQQQPYGTGAGAGVEGQAGYSSPYDRSQYAPQPGSDGERAAQEAIQYGWYQQPGEQPEPPAEPRRDTPLEPFFHEDSSPTDQTQAVDPVYGTPYGQQTGEGTENSQGWYREDDRR
ncbi:hypothetical protein ACFQZ2_03630 [Streptomonospora algeriensis]|uniref:34 kDa antigenic protein n=1 Tax=Streptomonospora algeriensis TaxID=995084 RepID=A0ABW3BAR2_9ACTN